MMICEGESTDKDLVLDIEWCSAAGICRRRDGIHPKRPRGFSSGDRPAGHKIRGQPGKIDVTGHDVNCRSSGQRAIEIAMACRRRVAAVGGTRFLYHVIHAGVRGHSHTPAADCMPGGLIGHSSGGLGQGDLGDKQDN
ncbi:MAG: hypothetical protein HKM93_09925 [Desulfobacteraceae bacterium]|nr:hypothetical protein [Desulfobacteraceae bacterium]